jgi:hypothetical protein
MPHRQPGHLLGERLPLAPVMVAEEPTDLQLKHSLLPTDRSSGQPPLIPAVHPARHRPVPGQATSGPRDLARTRTDRPTRDTRSTYTPARCGNRTASNSVIGTGHDHEQRSSFRPAHPNRDLPIHPDHAKWARARTTWPLTRTLGTALGRPSVLPRLLLVTSNGFEVSPL